MSYLGNSGAGSAQSQITLPLDVASGGTASSTPTDAKVALAIIGAPNDGNIIESGTTAQRGSPAITKIRYNIDTSSYEGSTGSTWSAIGGGAKNDIFFINKNILTVDTTIATGENAMSAGPVTIANGVLLTVASGATWTVVGA